MMDKEIINSLKQALTYLKNDERGEARPILVNILKQEPNNDQAWFLLSFSVTQEERQIYALEQAILHNADNRPAILRLAELRNEPIPVFEEDDAPESIERLDDDIDETYQYDDTAEENDLLSQRLLENSTPSIESNESENPFVEEDTIPLEDDTFVSSLEEEKEDKSDFVEGFGTTSSVKIPRIDPRFKTIGIVAIVVVIVVGGASFFLRGLSNPTTSIDENAVIEIIPIATNTRTPNTAIEVTVTAVPTFTTTVIKEPTSTPMLATLSPGDIDSISVLQGQIEEVRGLIPNNQPQISMESSGNMESLIKRLVSGSEFDEAVQNDKSLYLALGLMSSSTSMIDFQRNQWGDPGVGIYLPDSNLIVFTGFRYGNLQKYLFSIEYTQFLAEETYKFTDRNIYPNCEGDIQSCQVWSAIVKGDAMFTTNNWISSFASEAEKNHFENMFVQYYLVPIQGVVPFIIEDLKFPYEKGTKFIEALFNDGAQAKVELAYYIPPTTTEHILHPEKYLEFESAITINDNALSSVLDPMWTETYNASIGEWTTYLLLTYPREVTVVTDTNLQEVAATGWGGDQIQVYRNTDTSQIILGGHWSWDTILDAEEFVSVLSKVLQTRYSILGTGSLMENYTCWESFNEISCVRQTGIQTIWITAPTIEDINNIAQLYNFDPQ